MKSIFAALIVVALAVSVAAADLANRLFAEAQAGVVWRQLDGPLLNSGGIAPGSEVDFRSGSSRTQPYGGAFVGLRMNEWLSFRAGYQDFGATEVTARRPAEYRPYLTLPTDFRFRDTAFTLDPVLTWRISPRVRLQGYWGIAFNRTDTRIQNYRLSSPFFVAVVVGEPITVTAPISFDPKLPDERTLSHLSRAGASVTFSLTDKLDLNFGLDRQRLSSFADEAWLAHVGVAYAFDSASRLRDRLYTSASAGAIWRNLDGPLVVQPSGWPGAVIAYRDGASDRSAYSAVAVGVRATDWLSVEIGYHDFGTTAVSITYPNLVTFPEYFPPTNFRSRDYAFTVDPVFIWKARSWLELHSFLGLAFNRSDVVCENQDFYQTYTGYFGRTRWRYQANSSHTTQARLGVAAVATIFPGVELRIGEEYQKFSSFAASGWMTHVGIVMRL